MGPVGSSDNGQSTVRARSEFVDVVDTDAPYTVADDERPSPGSPRMETRNRVLSVEGLTPEQKKQRDNYAVELAAAAAKLADLHAKPKPFEIFTATGTWESLPWNRAMALIPGLQTTQQWNSSVSRSYDPVQWYR